MEMGFDSHGSRNILTQPKVQVNAEDGVDASPEEGGLGPPVPLSGVDLAIGDDIDEGDVDGIVGVAR